MTDFDPVEALAVELGPGFACSKANDRCVIEVLKDGRIVYRFHYEDLYDIRPWYIPEMARHVHWRVLELEHEGRAWWTE